MEISKINVKHWSGAKRISSRTVRVGASLATFGAAVAWSSFGGGYRTPSYRAVVIDSVPVEILKSRRARLFEQLDEGIAVIRSADRRELDEYPQDSDFRQDNNFYYLTGLEVPNSWLVLFSRQDRDSVALFVPDRDPWEEIWTGPGSSLGEISEGTGIRSVYPTSQFEKRFVAALGHGKQLSDYERLYVVQDSEGTREVVEVGLRTRRAVLDLVGPLSVLRLVKDSLEISRLERAAEITVAAIKKGMREVTPGMYEYELEAIIEYVFRSNGAERVGFPSIVGSGPNSVILHHDKNRRRMEAGDLVVVDVGAEYGYYTADITRTFPVSGRFSPRQRAIYQLVLCTQNAVLEALRPGVTIAELRAVADHFMLQHSKGLCGRSGCERYFVHGLSHWLGMDVHDVGGYDRPLQPGMVLTVEPGIYLADEEIGVRIEDDILVTEDGYRLLSVGLPRTVDEIEALMDR